MGSPSGRHVLQRPEPMLSHPPHCGGKMKSKIARSCSPYIHALGGLKQGRHDSLGVVANLRRSG